MSSFSGYQAATERVALSDQSLRARLEVTGPDRAKFLHNLTTNEVKRIAAGRGVEAFVTSPQGKTLALVTLLVREDSILVSAVSGGLALALPHFQKYGVFDEIQLEDCSQSTFELHLAGPRAEDLVLRCGGTLPEPVPLGHLNTTIADRPVLLWRDSPTGRPGLSLMVSRGDLEAVLGGLEGRGEELGLEQLDSNAYEAMRIEAGTPAFGRDLSEKNLPQEAGRDGTAINFVKGCYLGQETVARIDALGHVNQFLKGLRLSPGDPLPAPGTPLVDGAKQVGLVTSSAFSPGWNAPIALAMLRSSHAAAGTRLELKSGDEPDAAPIHATLSDIPMLPPA